MAVPTKPKAVAMRKLGGRVRCDGPCTRPWEGFLHDLLPARSQRGIVHAIDLTAEYVRKPHVDGQTCLWHGRDRSIGVETDAVEIKPIHTGQFGRLAAMDSAGRTSEVFLPNRPPAAVVPRPLRRCFPSSACCQSFLSFPSTPSELPVRAVCLSFIAIRSVEGALQCFQPRPLCVSADPWVRGKWKAARARRV